MRRTSRAAALTALFAILLSLLVSAQLMPEARAAHITDNPDKTVRLTDTANKAYIDSGLKGTVGGNDPLSQYQWYLRATDARAAWDADLSGKGVQVAVIDSGINAAHADFAGTQIAAGHNYIDNNSDTRDSVGHGTFVAGIIAAQTGNGVGIDGMTDGVTLIPLKVFNGETASEDDIIRALYDAVDIYHCDIINMSFGYSAYNPALHSAIQHAYNNGVLLVAAVGNDGTSVPDYPASFPEVVGVGSVSYDAQTSSVTESSFSERSGVFVTAPGADIVSLGYDGVDSYYQGDGTSFSAPQVTAMAAMAKEASHDITPDMFKALLQYSAVDLGDAGKDDLYGYGLINVKNFVGLLQTLTQSPPAGSPSGSWADVYKDVSPGDWFYSAVGYVSENHLFQGTATDAFSPQADMTRSMFVTVLGRLFAATGHDLTAPAASSIFTDTEPGAWYYDYVNWAAGSGIVQGYDDSHFGTNDNVTREQIAVFLYRYAQAAGYPLDNPDAPTLYLLNGADKTSDWADVAMKWAVANGLIRGESGWELNPGGIATRAEVAQIMARFCALYGIN